MSNDINSYICKESGLTVLELEKYRNVRFSENYIVNIKKIGESIIFSSNVGDMAFTNMKKYYLLIEQFIKEANVKYPIIEIRDLTKLKGLVHSREIKYQRDYLMSHEDQFAGLILSNASLWLKGLASAGFRNYKTSIIFKTTNGYSESINTAINILKYKTDFPRRKKKNRKIKITQENIDEIIDIFSNLMWNNKFKN